MYVRPFLCFMLQDFYMCVYVLCVCMCSLSSVSSCRISFGYMQNEWLKCRAQSFSIRASDGWYVCIKLISFELAAKFSRRRQNPVQPRLCNAKNAIFKRLKTGFCLRLRSSPANSNAISFSHIHAWLIRLYSHIHACGDASIHTCMNMNAIYIHLCNVFPLLQARLDRHMYAACVPAKYWCSDACLHEKMRTFTYTCATYTLKPTSMHAYKHAYMHTCVHAYIFVHIYDIIFRQSRSSIGSPCTHMHAYMSKHAYVYDIVLTQSRSSIEGVFLQW
jgi:hypothetical protein